LQLTRLRLNPLRFTRHGLQLRMLRGVAFGILLGVQLVPARARAAEVDVQTAHTVYYEAPPRTRMFVYSPGLSLSAKPADWLRVSGGYEADIVSGASVAVKAGASYQAVNASADVISTASVYDYRHRGNLGLIFKKGDVELRVAAIYSRERDYQSKTLSAAISTEAYEHNTRFELSYAKTLDDACDRVQAVDESASRARALENSNGCFSADPQRRLRDVDSDGFQLGWTQAWTPRLTTQTVYSAQIIDGFQSNPYRSVVVGQGAKAQENHPSLRARHALAVRTNYYWKPLRLTLKLGLRAYADSWGIASGTAELEVERAFGESFRLAARGRAYRQRGAVFFSDDYTGGNLPDGPKGQYFTGDRELSPFWSALLGLRAIYTVVPAGAPAGKSLALGMRRFQASAALDALQFRYEEFTLGGTPIRAARALVGTLSVTATF
jgi:hypothetical protein